MRFPVLFKRFKGVVPAGQFVLGADVDPPVSIPGTPSLDGITPGTNQNLLAMRFSNINGYPVHRVAVLWHGPPGSVDGQVKATMYFFEDVSQRWWRIGAADKLLQQDAAVFFDNIGLPDLPNTRADLIELVGSNQMLLVVKDQAAVVGEHDFLLAGDITVIGT